MENQSKVQYVIFGLLLALLLNTGNLHGQNEPPPLENRLRLNFLNPGIDYELRLSRSTVLSIGAGIGYFGGFEELSGGYGPQYNNTDFSYIFAPFADVQYKWIYNRNERDRKGKPLAYNSGNFVSLRGFWKGKSLKDNVNRLDDNDFFTGITWGLQRSYGKFHFLFDVGPVYYFDTMGNSGFFPFLVQINLGLNLGEE